ncbi:MAG: hypothetical protein LAT54_04530 [Cryomorphaceae bacterium]|nr:hypothetical protein [Cryomorphaceae bacterium]
MMSKSLIVLALLLLSTSFAFSQTETVGDSITMESVFGSPEFYIDGKKITLTRAIKIMKPNPMAYDQMRTARKRRNLSNALGITGGFIFGWQVGAALGGGEPNWVIGSIGAGLMVASFPINSSYKRKAKEGIDTYNSGLRSSSFWERSEINISFAGNGIGLIMRF